VDTQITGDTYVEVRLFCNQTSTGAQVGIQQTDDPSSSNLQNQASVGLTLGTVTINSLGLFTGVITARYWRFVFQNGATAASSLQIVATTSANSVALVGQGQLPTLSNSIPVNISFATQVDGSGPYGVLGAGISAAPLATAGYAITGTNNITSGVRTPAIFKGGIVQANFGVIWVPQIARKVRLMRYKLELSEDVTISGGPLPVQFAWNWVLPTTTTATATSPVGVLPTFYHRVVVPASVLATSGVLWDSDWVDLGNGFINPNTSAATNLGSLQLGICVTQGTGATTPTFTIASNQWEATTIGFKSVASLGGARLRQAQAGIGVASAVSASLDTRAGNTLIVIVRSTNIAAGAPTITVTDTQLNSYTNLAQNTNATDSANGSTLQISYFINLPASLANTITATTSVHAATITQMWVLEVEGIAAVGATGQSAATGNTTAPSGGSYTPGEAGDYLVTAFATAASLAAQPVIATAGYTMRGTIFTASGSVCVADNFGNGVLATGGVNAMVIGTEE
jgi:hypothetical protein